MISAKEKAKELFDKFYSVEFDKYNDDSWMDITSSKQCALIAVEEIIQLCKDEFDFSIYSPIDYWQEVKSEIENL